MKKIPIVPDSFRLVEWSQFDQRENAFLGDGSQQAAIWCAKATSFHSFGAKDLRVSVLLGSWRSTSWTKNLSKWHPWWRIEKTPDHLRPSYGFNSFTPGTPLYQQGRRGITGETPWWCWSEHWRLYNIYIYTGVVRQEMSFPFMAFRVEMFFEYPDDSRLLYIVR